MSGDEQKSKIKKFLIHPDYNEKSNKNDICLLYLEKKLKWDTNPSKHVTCIELANEYPAVGTNCQVSGWGLLKVSVLVMLPGYIRVHD